VALWLRCSTDYRAAAALILKTVAETTAAATIGAAWRLLEHKGQLVQPHGPGVAGHKEIPMIYGLTYPGCDPHRHQPGGRRGRPDCLLSRQGNHRRVHAGQGLYLDDRLTCLTGFGIFQHGGFGKPHALGIITLLVLGIAWVAGNTKVLGRASPYVETLSYSITFVFHMIPAITETSTRLPLGAPLLPNADAPELKAATGVLLLIYVVGAAFQVRRIRARNAAQTRLPCPARPAAS
jgi:hypothetical protein